MTHTSESLSALKFAEVKAIAAELNIVPSGNKSKKESWIVAILDFQPLPIIAEVVEVEAVIAAPIVTKSRLIAAKSYAQKNYESWGSMVVESMTDEMLAESIANASDLWDWARSMKAEYSRSTVAA